MTIKNGVFLLSFLLVLGKINSFCGYFGCEFNAFNPVKLRLVIGFSTGHVGTTSFSNSRSYRDSPDPSGKCIGRVEKQKKRGSKVKAIPNESCGTTQDHVCLSSVRFIFEKASVSRSQYAKPPNYTVVDELFHVKSKYIPFVLKAAQELAQCHQYYNTTQPDVITVVDLSHSSLFFYRGLLEFVRIYSERLSVHFVRIRRDRTDTVISMTSDKPSFLDKDWFRFHPFENIGALVVSVDKPLWSLFSNIQQALWVIDETEARWKQLLSNFPNQSYTEILWGDSWEECDITAAMRTFTTIVPNLAFGAATHKTIHAPRNAKLNETLRDTIHREDLRYQAMMKTLTVANFCCGNCATIAGTTK